MISYLNILFIVGSNYGCSNAVVGPLSGFPSICPQVLVDLVSDMHEPDRSPPCSEPVQDIRE